MPRDDFTAKEEVQTKKATQFFWNFALPRVETPAQRGCHCAGNTANVTLWTSNNSV